MIILGKYKEWTIEQRIIHVGFDGLKGRRIKEVKDDEDELGLRIQKPLDRSFAVVDLHLQSASITKTDLHLQALFSLFSIPDTKNNKDRKRKKRKRKRGRTTVGTRHVEGWREGLAEDREVLEEGDFEGEVAGTTEDPVGKTARTEGMCNIHWGH